MPKTVLTSLRECKVDIDITIRSLYPISNSDFTLYYKALSPGRQLPIDLTVLTSTLDFYLLTVIDLAIIERGPSARLQPPEDAYVKDLVAVRFKTSFTVFYPVLRDVDIIIRGMKEAAVDQRCVEPADIVVFKGGVSRNIVAGLSMTVVPGGSNSSLSDISSTEYDSSNVDIA